MTRSTLSPARRLAATLALAGVAGLGAVTVAPAAAAAEAPVVVDAPEVTTTFTVVLPEITGVKGIPALPALLNRTAKDITIKSPKPDVPVTFVLGKFAIELEPKLAKEAQSALATLYSVNGYPVAFTTRGVLVVGPRTCDPTKSAEWNIGCVTPTSGRF
jgi:hypothetical protein